jgi:uncharacterized repeat protein (TIGR01451 family)
LGSCAVADGLTFTGVSNHNPNVGDTVTYSLQDAPAVTTSTTISVSGLLPAGLTYVSSNPSVGTFDGTTGTWTSTESGASYSTLSITEIVNAGTAGQTIAINPSINYVQSNCTESSAATGVALTIGSAPVITPTSTPTSTVNYADLSVTKTADVTSTVVGGTVNYTVAVTDLGPGTSTDVTATDTLPAGLTIVSATSSEGSYVSSTGAWTIGDIAASSTATLKIAATVNTGTAGTIITNTAIATESASSTDLNLANNSSSVSVMVQNPVVVTPTSTPSSTVNDADLSIQKTVDNANPAEGATVNYTVAVTDNGPATSTGVVATDTLPFGLTFENATASVGSYSSSTGAWTIGDLSASSTAILNIAALVNSGTAGTTITNTAIVGESASSTDTNLSNNSSSASLTVQSNGGGLGSCSTATGLSSSVSDSNPATGETITYTLNGTVSVNAPTQVVVNNVFSSGLTIVSATASEGSYVSSTGIWNLGTVTGTQNVTLTVVATVNPGAAGQSLTSTATEKFSSGNCSSSSTTSNTITVQNPVVATSTVADIAVAKLVDNANPAGGATVNFTVTVTDNGPATSTFVDAHDALPIGLNFVSATTSQGTYNMSNGDWNIGTVSPNATATLQVAAIVDPREAGMSITNTATVSELSSIVDNNTANNSSSVTLNVQPVSTPTSTVNYADLSVTKTANVTSTVEGGTINYMVAVTDLGPGTSTGVTVTDVLPAGLTFVSASSSGSSYVSSTGIWNVGDLSASSTATLQIAATVNTGTAGTTITNTAVASESASSTDSNMANNSSSVSIPVASNACTTNCGGGGGGTTPTSTIADIGIAKTVDNANPAEGATVNYTLVVTAYGPATSTGVVATDTLPSGLTFVSATTSEGSYSSSTGTWNVGNLSASSTATLTIAATVNSGTAGETITNTGVVGESSIDTDNNPANNSSSVTLVVAGGGSGCTSNCGGGGGGNTPTAEIGIVKTVDNANPNPGDTINYTLTVSATGPSTSFGVVATDVLPSGVTFVSASTAEGSYANSTGIWTIGTLNVGQQAVLVITATVNAGTEGEVIANTGTVKESPSVVDQLSGNNSSTAIIDVGGNTGGGGTTVGVGSGGGTVGVGSGGGNGGGAVLGASCGLYLDQYIHPIRKYLNDSIQVTKLQVFLNMDLGMNLPLDGTYSTADIAAVDQFQLKYHSEVLEPWAAEGFLPTEFTPTEYVYQTTQRWINLIMCPPLNIPMPVLHVDNT